MGIVIVAYGGTQPGGSGYRWLRLARYEAAAVAYGCSRCRRLRQAHYGLKPSAGKPADVYKQLQIPPMIRALL
jgi:hypothetical protein